MADLVYISKTNLLHLGETRYFWIKHI